MNCARTHWSATALALVFATSACNNDNPPHLPGAASASAMNPPRPSSDQTESISAGNTVIVETATTDFQPGKVIKVEGSKVTYEYGANRTTAQTDNDRVYVLTPDHRTAAKGGDVAVCKTGETNWTCCVVKHVQRGVYVVTDPCGKAHSLTASAVVWPNAAARRRIQTKLERESKYRDFLNAAMTAGLPQRPDGWTPRPGDNVVAMSSDSSWYGGRIRRLTPSKIHITWDDKSSPSVRNHDEVSPKPETAYEVRIGQYVLGRPRRATRWDYYRVESTDEQGALLVGKDGRKRKVKQSDVIPLGR